MEKRMLYLECYSGISGDMTVGALLDLGANEEKLRRTLNLLELPGYEITVGRTKKNEIDACSFDVILPEHPHYDEGHGMSDKHSKEDPEADHTDHEKQHHSHHHTHHHAHRNLNDIHQILDRIEEKNVKELAKKIFLIVADAESKVHNVPIDQIHFHEVGAIDSIVDIVSAAVCFCDLGIDEVVVSDLYEGKGYVCCQHGQMPVPAPATLKIIESEKLYLHLCGNEGEMVTPTGAAIAAALKTRDMLPSRYRVLKTGLGAGKKDFQSANVLRAMMIEGM